MWERRILGALASNAKGLRGSGRCPSPPAAHPVRAVGVIIPPCPARTASPAALSTLRGLLPFLHPTATRGARLRAAVPGLGGDPGGVAFRDLIDAGFGGVSAGGAAAHEGAGLFGAQGLDGGFVALFGLAVFWAAAVAARYYTVSWIGERVTADLRSAVYARVLRQSPQIRDPPDRRGAQADRRHHAGADGRRQLDLPGAAQPVPVRRRHGDAGGDQRAASSASTSG